MYHNQSNYGGLLQAYALAKHLADQGFDTKQICYDNSSSSKIKYLGKIAQTEGIFKTLGKIFKKIQLKINHTCNFVLTKFYHADQSISTRKHAMVEFREGVSHTDRIYNIDTIYECDEFDIYICGSDQVWHGITSYSELNKGYWLRFVKGGALKISYAPSIALGSIPKGANSKIKEALEDFQAISVREKNDREQLEKIMCGRKIEWVLDPTLLLDQNDWDQIATKNLFPSEKYIFAYLLGDKKSDRKCIERFAKTHNLKIVTIPYLHNIYCSCDRKFGDIKISDVSPNVWVSLIKNAEYIFTDSFHGSVFSIIFHKNFYTFRRSNDKDPASMNFRIYSLFDLFGLNSRLISNQTSPSDILSIVPVDYEEVDRILNKERCRSFDFLRSAIEGQV